MQFWAGFIWRCELGHSLLEVKKNLAFQLGHSLLEVKKKLALGYHTQTDNYKAAIGYSTPEQTAIPT